jgi:nitrate reductase gamma subunit
MFFTIFSIEENNYHFLGKLLGILVVALIIALTTFVSRRLFLGSTRGPMVLYTVFAINGLVALTTIISIVSILRAHSQLRQQLAEGQFALAKVQSAN